MTVRRSALASCLTSCLVLASFGASSAASSARALDKQGAAHGGEVAGPDKGFEISGSLLAGVALYNPSYAARPDNSGLALFRVAPHLDLDLIGHRLSIPIDLNFFSDRQRSGAGKLAPTELDFISGLTSTWGLWQGSAVELGSRYERDMPVDRGRYTQSYVDARAKLMTSAKATHPMLAHVLGPNDVTTGFTLGYFAYNPTYAARPDNTGKALLRYAAHIDLSLPEQYLGVYVDTTFFTDRELERARKLRPTELDLTLGVAFRLDPFEVSLAYERDMPIDRGGFVQQFLFIYGSWSFTLLSRQEEHPPNKPPRVVGAP